MSIKLEVSGPAWEALGDAIGHLPKKFVANEIRNALRRCATIAAKDLRPRIPTRTKKLRKSIGTKSDKYSSGNSYAIVGFRTHMGVKRYQAPAIYGSGGRFNGFRYTGKAPGVSPDPFKQATAAVQTRCRIEVYAAIDKSVEKGTKRYPDMMKSY